MSKRWGSALAALVHAATAVQHPWRRANTRLRVAESLQQHHTVTTPYGSLSFVTSHPQALEYPKYFYAREPETPAWIDGFEPPCIFWDVGANIGAYATYAGLRAGVEVLAFEPASANYAALCRNIAANDISDRVRAYCVALSDRNELGRLNLSAPNAGSVFNAFESAEDCFGRPVGSLIQGMVGFSIDGFRDLFALPAPNYLKIDVDSIEERILAGAARTLADPALRSVLLELEKEDTARSRRLTQAMEASGFSLKLRSAGEQTGSVNGIFVRA